MMLRDLSLGHGFCLIDPHGDLAASLDCSSTQTICWDLTNPNCRWGFNPLKMTQATSKHLLASSVIDAFKKQWEDAWGPRMEHLFRYALLALLELERATLSDVMPMFLDKDFRTMVLSSVLDSQVRYFWEVEYAAMNYRTSADGVAPIANKIGAFLANPIVRKSLCNPECEIDFGGLLRTGTSLIVNLCKGAVGADSANLVGGLLVSKIASTAYERQGVPLELRYPYFLYVDEFHSFTTSSFADILSELRKYGLGIALSTQHTSQLSRELREAVFGNVGTLFVFRMGATDAELVWRQFGHNSPTTNDLVNLPNYEMYVRMMVNGVQSGPYSARTLPPNEP